MVASSRSGPMNWAQMAVGSGYTLWSIGTLIAVRVIKRPTARRSLWIPVGLTTIDFGATFTLGMLQAWFTGAASPAQHTISSAIVMSFSLARITLWHVVYSVVLAAASLIALCAYTGDVPVNVEVFVLAGYVVLGRMFHGLRQRDNLTRFLPRPVADRVMAQGPSALAPVEREITVLFSDIRGRPPRRRGRDPRARGARRAVHGGIAQASGSGLRKRSARGALVRAGKHFP